MKKPIEIDGRFFPTKQSLKERCQLILYRYKPEDFLEGDDFAFILAVLERHPNYAQKIGVGIAAIKVHSTDYGNQGFALVRTDGTWTDFSFLKCITPTSPMDDFKKAARNEIHDQVWAFKMAAFATSPTLACPLTGEMVTKETCHVDHEPPNTFEAILGSFMAKINLDPAKVDICGHEDQSQTKTFGDTDLRISWQEFHREHARLRITSAKGNLSLPKKKS